MAKSPINVWIQCVLIVWSCFTCVSVYAETGTGISHDLNHFFTSLGYASNVTRGHAFEGQQAGYYTGGSLYARNQVRNYQLFSATMPSVRAGCGGIDLQTGGFSYLGPGLEDAMKNVANNALSYAFLLGVETVTPEIQNLMTELQGFSNKVNMANISSCEMGASLDGALWPKTDVAQQQVCSTLGASNNLFSDYTQAKMQCGNGNQRTQTLNRLKNNDDYKSLVFQNTNVAWQAVRKNSFLSTDTELSELFMSLSGSIIIQSGSNDDSSNRFVPLPSLADDQDLINALLYGGKASIYVCDDTKECLHPTKPKSVTIDQSAGLATQVSALLSDMYSHIITDTPITDEEKGLLNSTQYPIYKILTVQAASTHGNQLFSMTDLAEVVATDILQQYLNENLDIMEASSQALQYPDDILKNFQSSIEGAREKVSALYRSKMHDVNLGMAFIEQTQVLEKKLAGQLSSRLVNTLNWAQGL